MKRLIVTGSSGLIGAETVACFVNKGWHVHGIDNNMRASFFGPQGSTRGKEKIAADKSSCFEQHELDIRDRQGIETIIKNVKPDAIVHTAAQPSHDKAAQIPFEDFDINAVGTLNLLEAVRRHCPEAPFVHMSTNKVYGDAPNQIGLKELETRWEFSDPRYENGIDESFRIDQSLHSLFGASKAAADLLVQEYGRYFGLPACCLRGGCLTGPNHAGVELHGFLSYLIKCNLTGTDYTVYGYKGKQVRDNIHSLDVVRFMEQFIDSPRTAEVYNIGGGKQNSCSILEAFKLVEEQTGKAQRYQYINENRLGDHICYYSDLAKMKSHYPGWEVSISLEDTISSIVTGWKERLEEKR